MTNEMRERLSNLAVGDTVIFRHQLEALSDSLFIPHIIAGKACQITEVHELWSLYKVDNSDNYYSINYFNHEAMKYIPYEYQFLNTKPELPIL